MYCRITAEMLRFKADHACRFVVFRVAYNLKLAIGAKVIDDDLMSFLSCLERVLHFYGYWLACVKLANRFAVYA
ncbi:hypothetical protein D3C85_1866100 [compost metagenome]